MKHGRLPQNSEEVLRDFLSGKTAKILSENPKEAQPYLEELTLPLVNVSTGRLYGSFEEKQWKPFAIDIVVVNPVRSGLLDRINARRHGQPFNSYHADFQVTIYGEKKGTILYREMLHSSQTGRALTGDAH